MKPGRFGKNSRKLPLAEASLHFGRHSILGQLKVKQRAVENKPFWRGKK